MIDLNEALACVHPGPPPQSRRSGYACVQATDQWWIWYDRYLNSNEWNERRHQVLKRDGYKCRRFGCENPATQVHHLSYRRVGYEPLTDLVSTCRECHEQVHARRRSARG